MEAGAIWSDVTGPASEHGLAALLDSGGGLVLLYLAWVILGHALWSESITVESRAPAVRTS